MKTATPKKKELFALPETLDLVVTGEVVRGNLDLFKKAITEGLEALNMEPETDEEFGQAEQDVKGLKEAEGLISNGKAEALKQAKDLQALFDELDESGEEVRQARLALEKKVKAKKEEIRKDILADELAKVEAVSQEHYRGRIEQAMKSKRTLKSWRDAAKKERIFINTEVQNARAVIDRFKEKHGESIALDRNKLELMGCEALETELQSRVDRLAAEEARKKAEAEAAAAKAETEAVNKQAEEAGKPPLPDPPKVGGIKVGGNGNLTPAESVAECEWEGFREDVFAALAPSRQHAPS